MPLKQETETNPSTKTEAEYSYFEFRVFLLLDRLPV